MRNPFKGFLSKRNPTATPRSVAKHAAIGAVAGAVVGYFLGGYYAPPQLAISAWSCAAIGAVLAAIVCAVYEWQVAD